MRHRRGGAFVLVLVSLALIAASCGSSSKKSAGGGATTTIAAKQGGDLVIGAEQEPDCMDWIASCASAAWGVYTGQALTMNGPYVFSDKNTYVPTGMLTGEATLVTSPKQVVTYHISPKAIWSDGQPVTSTDFKYSWNQIVTGKDIFSTTGYTNIESVDDSDPHTAVVTFKTPYTDWKSLFDQANEPLMPSHLLQGKDRSTIMKDGYTFSDGPWMLDHWTKGVEMKFVPNPMWWGHHPYLSSVTFKFITDTAAEQEAVKTGQVLAAFPQAQPGQEALKTVPGILLDAIPALSYEGIWFNVEKPPVNDVNVRMALAYASDRPALVTQLFGAIQPDIKPIQSWYSPSYGAFYTTPFAKYTLDLNKVNSLMTSSGWTKGADGIWAKGGQKANLELKTTTGNKRRGLTAQILQSEWKAAGFNLTITTEKAGLLFGNDLPAGNFQIGLFYQNPSDNDPGECVDWCSVNIPTQANGQSGENYTRINDPTLDKLWTEVDTSLDQAKRLSDAQQAQARLADLIPAMPIDPPPDIIVVNTDKVGNTTGKFKHNLSVGPFVYVDEWFLK